MNPSDKKHQREAQGGGLAADLSSGGAGSKNSQRVWDDGSDFVLLTKPKEKGSKTKRAKAKKKKATAQGGTSEFVVARQLDGGVWKENGGQSPAYGTFKSSIYSKKTLKLSLHDAEISALPQVTEVAKPPEGLSKLGSVHSSEQESKQVAMFAFKKGIKRDDAQQPRQEPRSKGGTGKGLGRDVKKGVPKDLGKILKSKASKCSGKKGVKQDALQGPSGGVEHCAVQEKGLKQSSKHGHTLSMSTKNKERVKKLLMKLETLDMEMDNANILLNPFETLVPDTAAQPHMPVPSQATPPVIPSTPFQTAPLPPSVEIASQRQKETEVGDNKNRNCDPVCKGLSSKAQNLEPDGLGEVSLYAVNNLRRYGFSKEYCVAALLHCNGDIGASLEFLLAACFEQRIQEGQKPVPVEVPLTFNCVEAWQEEVTALSSIFGKHFEERIPGRVWILRLELPQLTKKSQSKSNIVVQKTEPLKPRPLCKYFLKGSCRYGTACTSRHGSPTGGHQQTETKPEILYHLEVRIPKNSFYPWQAPLVAFSSENPCLSPSTCLHLSEKLYSEALILASTGLPAVFTLASVLDDDVLTKALALPPHPFSLSRPLNRHHSGLQGNESSDQRSNAGASWIEEDEEFVEIMVNQDDDDDDDDEYYDDEEDDLDVENDVLMDKNDEKLCKKPDIPVDVVPIVPLKRPSDVHSKAKMWEQNPNNILRDNVRLCKEFQKNRSSKRFKTMLADRMKLSIWTRRKCILDLLKVNQVIIVTGMTGCGKTTQVPQFILDNSLNGRAEAVCNIVCTQPRRISAISVAERVAQERAESLGVSVGYQIRLESVQSSSTRLMFCTTGVLLRRLASDPTLQGLTHILVDEVHERSEESDFLLLVLSKLLAERKDFHVILMSATIDAGLFSNYFGCCPVVQVPGHTFPVKRYYLEDVIGKTHYVLEDRSPYRRSSQRPKGSGKKSQQAKSTMQDLEEDFEELVLGPVVIPKDSLPDHELTLAQLQKRYQGCSKTVLSTLEAMDVEKVNLDLIEALLEFIVNGNHPDGPGAVLVFVPGFMEIKTLIKQLRSNDLLNLSHRCWLLPLHSSLSREEQQVVFCKPPAGVTKIIISTNIAETSLTIDDIVYVIDTGRMKETRYDPTKSMESLDDTWVSKANALQRCGRAGRVGPGICFHLFTSHHFNHQLLAQQVPEILRVPIEQLCLRIKILPAFRNQNLADVFNQLIEPPMPEALETANQRLFDIGALDREEQLTPLGHHLASLPIDVRLGKLMLLGCIFHCLDPVLTIAACLASRSPFVSPWENREEAVEKKRTFAVSNCDHLTMLKAYKGWIKALKRGSLEAHRYTMGNFLSPTILQEIFSLKRLFAELLSDIGFVREGLRARDMERLCHRSNDGIVQATGPEVNANSENAKLVSAMLCAALYPNVIKVTTPESKLKSTGRKKLSSKTNKLVFMTKTDEVHIHPSSINYQDTSFSSPFMVYHEKVRTSRLFVRDCSVVSVYPLLLFGGGKLSVSLIKEQWAIALDDGWIRVSASSYEVADLVRKLRLQFDSLLQDKICNPKLDLYTCPRGSDIIDTIVNLISTQ
uniref:putative ATP-dependent RNA helicase DHX57 isoform X2 n=1 Tax=Myxine glutinosa TaxID=7769 RepID=UPI00359015E6